MGNPLSSVGIEGIDLSGFQVVDSSFFTHFLGPSMTIHKTAISFNSASVESLNNCENVNIMVNYEKKRVLVKPVSSSEKDAIRWHKGKNSSKSPRLECTYLAKQIFEHWNFDEENRYRTLGRLVKGGKDNKLMLLFDFSDPQTWQGRSMVKNDG